MKQAKSKAYIRQVCCLGLSTEVLIPELLRALHGVIPSADNLFTGFDENMRPAYVLTEQFVPEALDVYLNEPAKLFTPEYSARMVEWFAAHRVLPDFRILDEQFHRRDFYNLVLRPYHHHHVIQGTVLDNGRCAGFLVLCRPANRPPFEAGHQQQFERVLPYLDHGWRAARHEVDQEYTNSGRTGLVILKRGGAVVSLSPAARHLLFLATYGVVPGGQVRFTREIATPPALRQVCAHLDRIFQNRDAPPPVCAHTNASGRFVFRAYWLEPPAFATGLETIDPPAHEALMGVMIEHHEPLRLRLLRNMQGSRLSIREQDVCLALADDLAYPAIAARLHLSPPTVATYIRRIHEKLGSASREELLKKLLAADPNQIN